MRPVQPRFTRTSQFQETYRQFTSSATTIQESLGSIARTLAKSADVYGETEDALKGSFIV